MTKPPEEVTAKEEQTVEQTAPPSGTDLKIETLQREVDGLAKIVDER